MNLHVYQWEQYDRPLRWWIIIGILALLLLWLSVWNKDRRWVLILLLIWGAYVRYERHTRHEMNLLSMSDAWLQLWKTMRFRHQLHWFSLDFYPGTDQVKTLFVYTQWDTLIYTPDDSQEDIADFVAVLQQNITYIKTIQLSGAKQLMRILRI